MSQSGPCHSTSRSTWTPMPLDSALSPSRHQSSASSSCQKNHSPADSANQQCASQAARTTSHETPDELFGYRWSCCCMSEIHSTKKEIYIESLQCPSRSAAVLSWCCLSTSSPESAEPSSSTSPQQSAAPSQPTSQQTGSRRSMWPAQPPPLALETHQATAQHPPHCPEQKKTTTTHPSRRSSPHDGASRQQSSHVFSGKFFFFFY